MEISPFLNDMDLKKDANNAHHIDFEKQPSYTFEEAITLTGNGNFHRLLLVITGLCLMAVICETMGVSFLMTSARCDLKFSLSEQGILSSAGFLGIVISSYFWGLLADTWGRQKALRISVTFAFLCSMISSFSLSIWMLSILRFLVGSFISGCQACAYSYLGEFHGRNTRAKVISLVTLFFPLGLIYIPATAIGILPLKIDSYLFDMKFSSWRIYVIICSIPTLIAAIVLPFLPESPKYLLVQEKYDLALESLRRVHQWNTNSSDYEYPVEKIVEHSVTTNVKKVTNFKEGLQLIWSQTAPLFNRARFFHTFNILFVAFVIYGISHGMFIWMPNIMNTFVTHMNSDITVCQAMEIKKNEIKNFNVTQQIAAECSSDIDVYAYVVIIIAGIAFTAIYIIIGLTINRFGKKRLLVFWMALTGICGICLVWSRNFWISITLIIIFLALGNCGGILNAIAVEYYPTNFNAMAMCLILMAGRFGDVAGNNIIAAILTYNCDTLFYIFGTAPLVCAMIACLLPGQLKEKN